ncbi:MAG: tetratricopeptide repeat protein [Acidobacteriia bacterium]|nr:tetratricopeptide repeat protein [Terriglobia bacterium]
MNPKEAPRLSSLELSWIESLPTSKILIALLLLVLLAFANSLSGEFVFDDVKYIVNNRSLRGPLDLAGVFTNDLSAFQTHSSRDVALPYYGRLYTLWLHFGFRLFHLSPPGWHLLNIVLHAGVSCLVFFAISAALKRKSLAVIAAALFAVHPIHAQAVAWISAAPQLLVALFFLAALLSYLRARRTHSIVSWVMAFFFFILSILCKETGLALPVVILGLEYFSLGEGHRTPSSRFSRRHLGRVFLHASGFLVISIVFVAVRYNPASSASLNHPLNQGLTALNVVLTIPAVVLSYLTHLLFPFRLSLLYDTDFVHAATSTGFLFPAIIVLILGAALYWIWRGLRENPIADALVFAGLLFWAPLLPVLNLRVFHPEYLVQDRYAYLPSIGFCLVIALLMIWLLNKVQSVGVQAAWVGVLLTALLIGVTRENGTWHDSVALWSRAETNRPQSWDVHYNLGLALLEHRRFRESEQELLEAARLAPDDPAVMNNLGMARMNLSETDLAARSFERAIQLDPHLVEAYINLGTLQFRMNNVPAAEKTFRSALAVDPQSKEALYNLARLQMARGDLRAAVEAWDHLLRINPEDAEARWQYGKTLKGLDRDAEARAQWSRALEDVRDEALRKKIESELNSR